MRKILHGGMSIVALLLSGCAPDSENSIHIRNDLKVLRLKSVEFRGTYLFSNVGPVSSEQKLVDEDWQKKYCGTSAPLEIELAGPLGTAKVHTVEKFSCQQGEDKSILIDDSTKFVNY
ncbi:MAG: hypothetical protein IPN71_00440 [Fibrobacteres bacterium]|nr:hypothetical protein [Fibrobacterota bacterium]